MWRIGLAVLFALSLTMVLTAEAQHVSIGTDAKQPSTWQPFLDGMRDLVEGRNLIVERAFAAGRTEHLPGLIEELERAGRGSRRYHRHAETARSSAADTFTRTSGSRS